MPALIADLGDEAAWRYVEFFTANIRNPHTRRAYARACGRFFAWCEDRGLRWRRSGRMTSPPISSSCSTQVSAPSVKQQLAAVRMLFDWLVIGQVVPTQSGRGGARAEARREDRQDAGARSRPSGASCSNRSPTRRCAICGTGR